MSGPRVYHWLPSQSFALATTHDEVRVSGRTSGQRLTRERAGAVIGTGLYLVLAITGWLVTTLLTTAGLFIALFFAAGNLTLAGFFEQVALLSTRYGEVAPAGRSEFDFNLTIVFALSFLATGFFRRAALVRTIMTGGVDGPASAARA